MLDFHIEIEFVTMRCWTMVDFHIETIFVTMHCWTMVDHGGPWMNMVVCYETSYENR